MRKKVNWGFVEPLYRAGALSNYEIARQYEAHHKDIDAFRKVVTEAAIRKQAGACGWEKDLGKKIRLRTEADLVRAEVARSAHREPSAHKMTEEEMIAAAAAGRAAVIESIRTTVSKAIAVLENLISVYHEDRDQVLVGWYKGKASTKKLKMGSLDRAKMGREISAMVSNLMPVLRTAWGLDDEKQGDGMIVEVNQFLDGVKL